MIEFSTRSLVSNVFAFVFVSLNGWVAEWLCRGLQILVRRFDSGPSLQCCSFFIPSLFLLNMLLKLSEILLGFLEFLSAFLIDHLLKFVVIIFGREKIHKIC